MIESEPTDRPQEDEGVVREYVQRVQAIRLTEGIVNGSAPIPPLPFGITMELPPRNPEHQRLITGWWLVIRTDGRFEHMKDREFRERYCPAP